MDLQQHISSWLPHLDNEVIQLIVLELLGCGVQSLKHLMYVVEADLMFLNVVSRHILLEKFQPRKCRFDKEVKLRIAVGISSNYGVEYDVYDFVRYKDSPEEVTFHLSVTLKAAIVSTEHEASMGGRAEKAVVVMRRVFSHARCCTLATGIGLAAASEPRQTHAVARFFLRRRVALDNRAVHHRRVRLPSAAAHAGRRRRGAVRHRRLPPAAEFLKSHLNATSDPCTNLYAYVCGSQGSPRAATEGPNNAAVEDEVMRLHAQDLAHDARRPTDAVLGGQRLQASAGDAVASRREAGAFKLCLERSSKQPQAFAEFMRQRGIPWPRGVDGVAVAKTPVLEVLFDLTVNWKVSLWFDLRVSKIVGNASRLVIREPGPLVLLRRRQLRGVESLLDYANLVRGVAAFLLNADSNAAGTLTDSDVRELYQDETTMRPTLDAFSDEKGEDELLTLKKVVALTFVNETSLLTLLRKYLPADDSVPERALDLIGWTFAYTYVWMVNPDFDHLTPPVDERQRDADSRMLCFYAVQESFGLLRIARNLAERGVVSNFVDKVSDVVRGTILVLVDWILQSDVISNVNKRTAVEKVVRSASVPDSLPVELQDAGPLDWIYASFPDNYTSFFDVWLSTRDADSSVDLRSVYEHPVVTSTYRWRSKNLLYLSSTNTLLSKIAAFYPPSYYQHGSVSMSYAGVGFQVTTQFLKTVGGGSI
ncbi:hypothetical protein HPB49_019924 [Dermacentor silvarum]|uniref:Uncharacterized protein n=1 Tax=Dermacentor silvarum TaxID=543639 RepID=A0ACB8CSW6_DERSI|nr:hypothetical protein HPB49_019924 [Dermacentor silvarum]